jgi:hypothetical protein
MNWFLAVQSLKRKIEWRKRKVLLPSDNFRIKIKISAKLIVG